MKTLRVGYYPKSNMYIIRDGGFMLGCRGDMFLKYAVRHARSGGRFVAVVDGEDSEPMELHRLLSRWWGIPRRIDWEKAAASDLRAAREIYLKLSGLFR